MTTLDTSPLCDTFAAAILLGMRPSTLRTWRSTGGGPAFVKFGEGSRKTVRYRLIDLQMFALGHAAAHGINGRRSAIGSKE